MSSQFRPLLPRFRTIRLSFPYNSYAYLYIFVSFANRTVVCSSFCFFYLRLFIYLSLIHQIPHMWFLFVSDEDLHFFVNGNTPYTYLPRKKIRMVYVTRAVAKIWINEESCVPENEIMPYSDFEIPNRRLADAKFNYYCVYNAGSARMQYVILNNDSFYISSFFLFYFSNSYNERRRK